MKIVREDVTIALFENKLLNALTKVHWSIPLVIYLPLVVFLFIENAKFFNITSLFILASGLLVWTFVEYFMHRFVFHYHPKSEFGQKIHYLFHGIHHHYPNDRWRLVLPPIVSIPLAIAFYFLFSVFIGQTYFLQFFFIGFILGYLFYDMLHYATHHGHWEWQWFKILKRHHLKHHFSDPEKMFGVSSKLWDKIFRS